MKILMRKQGTGTNFTSAGPVAGDPLNLTWTGNTEVLTINSSNSITYTQYGWASVTSNEYVPDQYTVLFEYVGGGGFGTRPYGALIGMRYDSLSYPNVYDFNGWWNTVAGIYMQAGEKLLAHFDNNTNNLKVYYGTNTTSLFQDITLPTLEFSEAKVHLAVYNSITTHTYYHGLVEF